MGLFRKRTIYFKHDKDDYNFFFSIAFFILTIVTTIVSIILPLLLKSRKYLSGLVCLNYSVDNTDTELFIYNKDINVFGKYYLDIDRLRVTLQKPLKPIVYKNYYIYNTAGDKVLTSRKSINIFRKPVYTLSLEEIIPDQKSSEKTEATPNKEEIADIEEPLVVQRWYMKDSLIHSPDMFIKITVNEIQKLKVVKFEEVDETACSWIFEEYRK
jgi:hypothetical protein